MLAAVVVTSLVPGAVEVALVFDAPADEECC